MPKMGLDRAKELRNSLLWGQVMGELDYRIVNKMAKFKFCSKEELNDIQKEVALLEEMKHLPEDVISREEDPGFGPPREEAR